MNIEKFARQPVARASGHELSWVIVGELLWYRPTLLEGYLSQHLDDLLAKDELQNGAVRVERIGSRSFNVMISSILSG
jgi:hypothetical protein